MKFDIHMGEHMTYGRLPMGKRCTSGVLELRNLLFRLFASIESSIVVHAVSVLCMMRKFSAVDTCAVPHIPALNSVLTAAGRFSCACQPELSYIEESGLKSYGRLDDTVVPVTGTSGLATGYTSAESMAVPFSVVHYGILHAFGNAKSFVEVMSNLASAATHKWIDTKFLISPACHSVSGQMKYAAGQTGMAVFAEATGDVARYRRLYEADPMTLAEMDDMSLEELDYIIC